VRADVLRIGGEHTAAMGTQYVIAWTDAAGVRRVGRLVLGMDEVVLDGTETSAPRRRAQVRADRAAILSANVLRSGDLPAVEIVTPEETFRVELVAGGRGAALALAHELAAD
jgi:hypothetical protein